MLSSGDLYLFISNSEPKYKKYEYSICNKYLSDAAVGGKSVKQCIDFMLLSVWTIVFPSQLFILTASIL